MAYIVMAYAVMAYAVMAYTVMAYIVMAYIVLGLYHYGLYSYGPVYGRDCASDVAWFFDAQHHDDLSLRPRQQLRDLWCSRTRLETNLRAITM